MRRVRRLFAIFLLGAPFETALSGTLPVPDAKSEIHAEAAVRGIYKDEFAKRSSADRQALAAKLLADGRKSTGDPAAQYAMLRQSAELAAEAEDYAGLSNAANALADAFAVKASSAEAEVLVKTAANPSTPDAAEALARTDADLLDQLIPDDQYDLASHVAALGVAAARKAHDAELLSRIESAEHRAHDMQTEAARYKTAQGNLAANPKNPEANFVAGKYLCFNRNDWEQGLPLLAKSSDAALHGLAEREIAVPTSETDQFAIADGWYALAAKDVSKGGTSLRNIRSHAAKWYAVAAEHLGGLERVKADRRLAELNHEVENPAQGSSDATAVALPAPKLTPSETAQRARQRKALIDDSKTAKDDAGRLDKLIEAAKITLQLDPAAGIAELQDIIKQATANNDGDRISSALLVEGEFYGSVGRWTLAEPLLTRVWKEFPGSGWGDKACEAADAVAKHYISMNQLQGALQYELIAMDCKGLWTTRGGQAGLWIADYYLANGDKARAINYLKEVIDKYPGLWDGNKKKAEKKLAGLGVTPDGAK